MAIDLVALLGADRMNLAAKEQVIAILRSIDQPATTRRYLYSRWARLVGVHPDQADLDRVAPWSQ